MNGVHHALFALSKVHIGQEAGWAPELIWMLQNQIQTPWLST